MSPDLAFEQKLWNKGYTLVIGVDEVGRGALAGPVVAGAVSLKSPKLLKLVSTLGINDSKKLSANKREKIVPEIKKYFYWGIGETGVNIINNFGIKTATERAMRAAVVNVLTAVLNNINTDGTNKCVSLSEIKKLNPYLLLDAFHVKYIPIIGLTHQQAIVRGDEKSITIAAASIIAKVYRDDLMKKLAKEFPAYGWEENAGYGTAKHIESIKKHRASRLHRTRFVDGIISK